MAPTTDTSVLIFGASGDLTSRKLIPALFRLSQQQYLAERCPVIGVARRPKPHDEFRDEMKAVVSARLGDKFDVAAWDVFARQLFYQQLDISTPADYSTLKTGVQAIEAQCGLSADPTRIVYLATTPSLFAPAVEGLSTAAMIPTREYATKLRVVVEKPFGRDLKSAQELATQLDRDLHESQMYRIDH